uniref:Uncharacterized protein n=1 Tax=Cannabis sativa TaxID=3483 RepID=A0A803QH99_CANSA
MAPAGEDWWCDWKEGVRLVRECGGRMAPTAVAGGESWCDWDGPTVRRDGLIDGLLGAVLETGPEWVTLAT